MKRPYRSGHCTPGNVDEQHQRCTGAYAGATCACDCHECGCGFLPDIYETGYREAVICARHAREHGKKMLDVLNAKGIGRDEIDAFDWDQYAAMGESA